MWPGEKHKSKAGKKTNTVLNTLVLARYLKRKKKHFQRSQNLRFKVSHTTCEFRETGMSHLTGWLNPSRHAVKKCELSDPLPARVNSAQEVRCQIFLFGLGSVQKFSADALNQSQRRPGEPLCLSFRAGSFWHSCPIPDGGNSGSMWSCVSFDSTKWTSAIVKPEDQKYGGTQSRFCRFLH